MQIGHPSRRWLSASRFRTTGLILITGSLLIGAGTAPASAEAPDPSVGLVHDNAGGHTVHFATRWHEDDNSVYSIRITGPGLPPAGKCVILNEVHPAPYIDNHYAEATTYVPGTGVYQVFSYDTIPARSLDPGCNPVHYLVGSRGPIWVGPSLRWRVYTGSAPIPD